MVRVKVSKRNIYVYKIYTQNYYKNICLVYQLQGYVFVRSICSNAYVGMRYHRNSGLDQWGSKR